MPLRTTPSPIQARRAQELLHEFLHPKAKSLPRDRIRTPARLVAKHERVYFDADRFRWYFHKREGRTLQQWRDAIDEEMRREETQHNQAG